MCVINILEMKLFKNSYNVADNSGFALETCLSPCFRLCQEKIRRPTKWATRCRVNIDKTPKSSRRNTSTLTRHTCSPRACAPVRKYKEEQIIAKTRKIRQKNSSPQTLQVEISVKILPIKCIPASAAGIFAHC